MKKINRKSVISNRATPNALRVMRHTLLRLCETISDPFGRGDFEPNRSRIFRRVSVDTLEKFGKEAGQKPPALWESPVCGDFLVARPRRVQRHAFVLAPRTHHKRDFPNGSLIVSQSLTSSHVLRVTCRVLL